MGRRLLLLFRRLFCAVVSFRSMMREKGAVERDSIGAWLKASIPLFCSFSLY